MSENNQIDNKFKLLYNKYITGIATEDEIKQLKELAKNSTSTTKKIEDAELVIRQMESLKRMRNLDTSSAFLRLKNQINQLSDKKGWLFYWQRAAAVLLIPVLLFSMVQLYLNNSQQDEVVQNVAWNEIKTMPGLRSNFTLPDGTKVWMNGSSTINYPLVFSGNERRIKLNGEAYFEVAKNPDKPFIVDMNTINVQAIGTAFNCAAYTDDNVIETALAEGKVKVSKVVDGKETGEYFITPGQIISYHEKDSKFYLEEENLDKYLAWRNGKFIFKNDPLEVVCKKLGRWYNAEVNIGDESLRNYAFTGTFTEESLVEIMDLISLSSPIRYTVTKSERKNENGYQPLKILIMKK